MEVELGWRLLLLQNNIPIIPCHLGNNGDVEKRRELAVYIKNCTIHCTSNGSL